MSAQFCVVLLALFSLTAAADPDCEELLKPLEDRSQVSGKWIYTVGTSTSEEVLRELHKITSSWIEYIPIPGSDEMTLSWADKVDGKCIRGSVNTTSSENSTTIIFHYNGTNYEYVGKHLKTSTDCVLSTGTTKWSATNGETKTSRDLYLFTKAGKLDDDDLEVFKKQAACLNFPANFHFGITDLCPDGKEAATDVKEGEQ
ncbi:uncharacterized protein LOC128365141 isoform X3 [Scomber japonicus]|uniref:uncharacterized protein LOC128365141 isoform X3 n=1 Tax=Scomber japonicus TaxID=13676 RepID=UPI002305AD00|nr:uncharacterized protein LOC128365141 isoform X3 [Scomber japonicus]